MLIERQGWVKSTSKNVEKAYLDIQITANHYIRFIMRIINDIVIHGCINNKLNTVPGIQNNVCTPFHIVPEQCSKCSRRVNEAAPR
jgi:hypothetical protein